MHRDTCQSFCALAGRILLSAIFLFSGFHKLTDWSGTAATMTGKGMPAVPLLLAGAIAFEILGGLSVLLGLWGRGGAALLILFLIPTTLVFHNFWAVEAAQQQMQMIHFMKNLAIMGGLFVVAGMGTGRYSVDRWFRSATTSAPVRDRERREPMMVG